MRKPSVIFFNRVYPPVRGASGRMLRDLARGFVRDGWNVTIVTSGPKAGREREGAVRVIRVKSTRKGLLSYIFVWLKMLLKGCSLPRHDLVVTMTDPPLLAVAGQVIAKHKKSKHIHWCQDLYPDLLPALGIKLPKIIERALARLSRKAMKACDKVIVIGRYMAKNLTRKGIPAGSITVIPNWPDPELFIKGRYQTKTGGGPDGMKKEAARRKVKAAKPYEELLRETVPKFRVLYAGSLGRAHPVRTIIDAARMLGRTNPEIEFVFVGDGKQFDGLAAERDRLELENIRFLPYQPSSRLRELMESGDMHLVSMDHNAAGLLVPCKLYSALAVGRPCIFLGPEESEAALIVQDYQAGVVIAQGEATQLAETILRYRNDSALWFAAHEGATKAGKVFVPSQSISVWLDRARTIAAVPPRRRRKKTLRKKPGHQNLSQKRALLPQDGHKKPTGENQNKDQHKDQHKDIKAA